MLRKLKRPLEHWVNRKKKLNPQKVFKEFRVFKVNEIKRLLKKAIAIIQDTRVRSIKPLFHFKMGLNKSTNLARNVFYKRI